MVSYYMLCMDWTGKSDLLIALYDAVSDFEPQFDLSLFIWD